MSMTTLETKNQRNRAQADRARAMVARSQDQVEVTGRAYIRGDWAQGNLSKRVGLWNINTKPGTTLEKVQAAYLASLAVADASADFSKEALASGRFTPDGLKAATLDHGVSKLAVQLKRGQQVLDRARRELDTQKAKLAPPAPDKADAAGAIRRWEFRQWFRGLSDRERSRYMLENREKMNPEEAAALMEVPANRTGISEIDHKDLIDRAMRAAHGDLIDDVAALEAGVSLAETANAAARDQLAKDGGVTVAAFNELAAPHEAKAATPWLTKATGNDGVERTFVMDLERKNWVKATPEQIEAGEFYPTWKEFNEANGRPADAQF